MSDTTGKEIEILGDKYRMGPTYRGADPNTGKEYNYVDLIPVGPESEFERQKARDFLARWFPVLTEPHE